MKNKVLISIFILLFIFTTSVFATDSISLNVGSASSVVASKATNLDLYVSDEKNYILEDNVSGNVFITSDDFTMLNTSSVKGNLYLVADTVTLKSDVVYSDAIAKDGNYSIDKINSHATVYGNVFVVCKEFTLEPGCEINGDLYIVSNSMNLQKSSTVNGNIFATSNKIVLNGRVSNSIYAVSKDFSMNYYSSITNDLNLSAENTTLSSVIHRNAYISANNISTTPDFLLHGNLEVDSSLFDFSGQVDGNANINSKELNFINEQDGNSIKCLIKGNLDYSSYKELDIGDTIVNGSINHSAYVEESSFSVKVFLLNLIAYIFYILAVVFIFKLIAKNYTDVKRDITVKNTFLAFGIGLLSFLVVMVLTILLFIINIGVTLAFLLVLTYILLLFLSTPLFILDIANLLKEKLNFYLATVLISLVLFLVIQIPVAGGIIMFLFTVTGSGRIVRHVLKK